MSRVTSPTQPFSSAPAIMPTPALQVGQHVVFDFSKQPLDEPYMWKTALRHLIRDMRKYRHERPMHPFNKQQIRERMNGMRSATCIQVAGICPTYGQNVGAVAAEGYLAGWPGAAGPLEFTYYLCFRWQNAEGHTVAFIPKVPMTLGHRLRPVADDPAGAERI